MIDSEITVTSASGLFADQVAELIEHLHHLLAAAVVDTVEDPPAPLRLVHHDKVASQRILFDASVWDGTMTANVGHSRHRPRDSEEPA